MAPRKPAATAKAQPSQKPVAKARVTKKASPAPAKTRGAAKATVRKTRAATKQSTATTAATIAATKKREAKPVAPKPAAKAKPVETKKRKSPSADEPVARPVKKARVEKPKVVINEVPAEKLNVYVFGEGSSGELGLGTAKNAVDVKRPRLNPLLPADSVGVVQVASGGMHCVALTHDNKILTWGVNDQGALGRDTAWEGGMKDVKDNESDSDSDSDDSDSGLSPRESIPTAIPSETFPEGTIFVQVAAGDSVSFALTDDGLVYGWGTFRSNDGVLGFDQTHRVQMTPLLVSGLKKIKQIACGDNHALALDEKGAVFAWGSGEQNQLGRRIVERNRIHSLQPREFGLPKGIVHVGCGAFHSFAIHKSGKVYSWGLNSYGETAVRENAGGDEAAILHPAVVDSLQNRDIIQICGGSHHSLACTSKGEVLVWGRVDGSQTGLKVDTLPDDSLIKDGNGHPRILIEPTAIPGIDARYVAAGSDHSLVIDKDGRVWSWGFSANYQTGQGTDDDIEVATVIDNTAVRGKALNWAGAGGQFSVITEPAVAA
ncbi:hypothetical protein AJ80_06198 [Polytolypa hystricis UAMH7299]|uniref:RCC1-like domain-containing protein n=1 Tax=Polytolypa hystricis (strain UAMH7299) TaxID=1447883 RepID=A0A2B7XY36_POLH7|nr:hypothetical protein AJ80_06198 [Polytolypa hystricis UAMH7299]